MPPGGDLVLDVLGRDVDEAVDELAVGLVDVGVVGGGVGERAQHGAVLGEHGDDALGRLARERRPVALALEPAVGHREQLAADVLDDPQHEVVAVAEVDVERRPRELGPPHDLVDGQLAERPLAQQRLGGGDDLLLGDLGRAPAAPARLRFGGDVHGHALSLPAAALNGPRCAPMV